MNEETTPAALRALLRSSQGRTAVAMTGVLVITLVVLLVIVPSVGRITLAGSVLSVALLWWITGGSKPWIWPYSGRRAAPSWLRLIYCVLQLSRSIARLLIAAAAAVAVAATIAAMIVALTVLFDLASNGHVEFSGYTEFFAHDLPRWLGWGLHGHVGTRAAY